MNLDKYMTIPFKDFGRTFEGADCYGLCMLVKKFEEGITLPDVGVSFQSSSKDVLKKVKEEIQSTRWVAVIRPAQFDFVLMSAVAYDAQGLPYNGLVHVGLYINGGRVLHTEKDVGVKCEEMDRLSIKNRIAGFYRYVG